MNSPDSASLSLEGSPLFRLESKRRLASLLRCELADLRNHLKKPTRELYEIRPNHKRGKKKGRDVQVPQDMHRRLHDRILVLLRRTTWPDYMHSGTRGRSYITNARVHEGAKAIFKTDIKSFFANVFWGDVYRFFRDTLKCSRDISGIMAQLCTVSEGPPMKAYLPTGSPLSDSLAFWSFSHIFEQVHRITRAHNLRLSIYVDDITVSGDKVPPDARHEIRKTIGKGGLTCHKDRYYPPGHKAAIITGVALTQSGQALPNRRRKAMREGLEELQRLRSRPQKIQALNRLIGQHNEGSQFDPRLRATVRKLVAQRQHLERAVEEPKA